jgi:ornithine cyclodeaminase/alanine dehydrogenase-like protein (mu-crystallin family)
MKVINNADVSRLVNQEEVTRALESAYQDFFNGTAVCRPRVDVEIPSSSPDRFYRWGTMEGGSAGKYFAIRCKSDMIYHKTAGSSITQEKYCVEPGTFCGFILLFSVENGEPLALINDGVIQHMRVAADGAIGVKYASREDSKVIGLLGSGGMAKDHLRSVVHVRDIERVQIFSPTKANREAFAEKMSAELGIAVVPVDAPEDAVRDVDIIMGLTDSAVPVIKPEYVEPGHHLLNVGGGGGIPREVQTKVSRFLRFGNTDSPVGWSDTVFDDEHLTWQARSGFTEKAMASKSRAHGVVGDDRLVYLSQVLDAGGFERHPHDVTYSERGNLQGNQFHAVAGLLYEKAIDAGVGAEIPTELFLQDIRN